MAKERSKKPLEKLRERVREAVEEFVEALESLVRPPLTPVPVYGSPRRPPRR